MNNSINKNRKGRFALMGGTFDPIHFGHLIIAQEALSQFCLDEVIFIPAGHPPHKRDKIITPYEYRLAMTKIATESNPYFSISTLENERIGPSYSIDTVKHYIKQLPIGSEIFFITGADAILDIPNWKDYQELISLCNFIAATRPGYSLEKIESSLKELPKELVDRIHPMKVPLMDISSTNIRENIKKNKSVRYQLPEKVLTFIIDKKLYNN